MSQDPGDHHVGDWAGMKISVCMATYNGEQFIHEQLESILGQLEGDDEIVIVDDASTDKSVRIAERFSDKRIRIFRQARNCGVLKTFERALKEATGEIIFLADQDDIWRPDKVSKIKSLFSARPDLSLVLTIPSLWMLRGRSLRRLDSGRGGSAQAPCRILFATVIWDVRWHFVVQSSHMSSFSRRYTDARHVDWHCESVRWQDRVYQRAANVLPTAR